MIFETIDKLFDENKPKEAESFMLKTLEEAKQTNDLGLVLQLYNELIGYYRQTSERENLLDVIGNAEETAISLGMEGTVPYATTTLNIATGYRSIGAYDKALEYYDKTEAIYKDQMSDDDIRTAGFYNNKSLLLEEMGRFEDSLTCQLKALAIAEKNEAGFEIAVSNANIANSCVALKRFDEAKQYAQTAISIFIERNCVDAHCAAAISALGMCRYHEGDYAKAKDCFEQGMSIIEQTMGRNSQYYRMKESYDKCLEMTGNEEEIDSTDVPQVGAKQADTMTGMELCKKYYMEIGAPMIHDRFAAYESRIAAGLVGEGSDCYGYDDSISRDHDWGPEFCIWVTKETYDEIGDELTKAYNELPDEFEGFKRTRTGRGSDRRGVFVIDEFYEKLLGVPFSENIENITSNPAIWEYALATATNGEVFRDDEGRFTEIREKLAQGYSDSMRLMKLAMDVANFSQNGQYNYFRMLERGDYITADIMLGKSVTAALTLEHHINRVYTPHEKWLRRSTENIESGMELIQLIEQLKGITCNITKANSGSDNLSIAQAKAAMDAIGEHFAREMYALSDISDVECYLDYHIEELTTKAEIAEKSVEELAKMIARLEFTAFDKVRNEGGRASCQNDWPTFSVMRRSQYLTWDRTMLMQYYYDFDREFKLGHNMITEKYGRMMESTAPDKYEEIKDQFPVIEPSKKAIIEEIVRIQMNMVEEYAKVHPKVVANARDLHTYEDDVFNTSYETYLRGEISTYSDKMLQLYAQHVIACSVNSVNIAEQTMTNTAILYGFKSIEEFEAQA